eukprot:Hpha_TRINITY_DN16728_c1_g8::TRINITY_DN16728_c1_g8_i1::g.78359::m.78359
MVSVHILKKERFSDSEDKSGSSVLFRSQKCPMHLPSPPLPLPVVLRLNSRVFLRVTDPPPGEHAGFFCCPPSQTEQSLSKKEMKEAKTTTLTLAREENYGELQV